MRVSGHLTPSSRFANWKPISVGEMEGFTAVIINTGLIQLPEIEAYWSTKWTGEIPFFVECLLETDLNKSSGCCTLVGMTQPSQIRR